MESTGKPKAFSSSTQRWQAHMLQASAAQRLPVSVSETVVWCVISASSPAVTSQTPKLKLGKEGASLPPHPLHPPGWSHLLLGTTQPPQSPQTHIYTHMHRVKNPKRHIPRVLWFLGWKNEGFIIYQPSISNPPPSPFKLGLPVTPPTSPLPLFWDAVAGRTGKKASREKALLTY